ncbi:MAG TPA: alanine dehydrogenase [Acetobacteraceae bacterium]|jgi:alanine dehydrogenase|nr:alanine dehydrogenase [Acetobacteraceae bacterium]
MLVGVPKEIKNREYRVGLSPSAVAELVAHGHRVLVETGVAAAVGYTDDDYRHAGASIARDAAEVFAAAEMIVKVKEPQPAECAMLQAGQVLFTYLHIAADPALAARLQATGCIAIAYETVTDAHGRLPLLAPMSEIAGRLAVQVGATTLQNVFGGAGILLGGVPGVLPATVTVLGGGVVGANAARMAMGLGADVVVLDRSLERLVALDNLFGPRLKTAYADRASIEALVPRSDLVIGAVLVTGAAAPKLLSRATVAKMRPGSVFVDVAIDQGGCAETSRPTTHDAPTYVEEGVIHYCVTNMPGGVARTATQALGNATLPYVLRLADRGWRAALRADPHLRAGLNVAAGTLTHEAVGRSLNRPWVDAATFLDEMPDAA